MLVLKVSLVPCGDIERERILGTVAISNVGGTIAKGNYRVRVYSQDVAQEIHIKGYARSRGFWNLVKEAINKIDFDK